MKVILSLCDYTGNWSQPYVDAGYRVIRIDIQKGQDVRLLKRLDDPIHGILSAPPCTHFSRAGAQFWKEKGDAALLEGLSIVDACLRIVMAHSPVWWVLENPIGRLKDYLGEPVYKFDPCEFGDPWTKRTWLWGKFAPPVPITCPQARRGIAKEKASLAPGWLGDKTTRESSRSVQRSATPKGFSQAFFEANP